MKTTWFLAAAAVVHLASAAEAQTRRVGPWEVTTERNRFGDGNNVVIASQVRRGIGLAVRCLADRAFSLAIIEGGLGTGRLSTDMAVSVRTRVDDHPVQSPDASVISDRVIQIDLGFDAAKEMLGGRELAVRLTVGQGSTDHVFSLARSRDALAGVFRECAGGAAAAAPPTPNPSNLASPRIQFGAATDFRDRFAAKVQALNARDMSPSGGCIPPSSGGRLVCRYELPGSVYIMVIAEDATGSAIREVTVMSPTGREQILKALVAMALIADVFGANDQQKRALTQTLTSVRPSDPEIRRIEIGGTHWWGGVAPGMGLMMGVTSQPSTR